MFNMSVLVARGQHLQQGANSFIKLFVLLCSVARGVCEEYAGKPTSIDSPLTGNNLHRADLQQSY